MTETPNGTASIACRRLASAGILAAALVAALPISAVMAQSLTVLPVSIQMAPGQMSTELTVINMGDTETSVQVRSFTWNQAAGDDVLATSDEVLASPPLTTIPPATTQVVRLVLRKPPAGHEGAYRILLDQVPPPAAPGTVRIALRLSIPIFAEPTGRVVSHVKFHVENNAGQAYLIALNDGGRHDTIRDIKLTTNDGTALKTEDGSPYVLSGATRRWRIANAATIPALGGSLRLTARSDSGVLTQPVSVVASR